jgi:hypothetical protein
LGWNLRASPDIRPHITDVVNLYSMGRLGRKYTELLNPPYGAEYLSGCSYVLVLVDGISVGGWEAAAVEGRRFNAATSHWTALSGIWGAAQ